MGSQLPTQSLSSAWKALRPKGSFPNIPNDTSISNLQSIQDREPTMVRVFPDVRYLIIPTPLADPRILQDFGTLLQDFVPRVDDLC